MVSQTDMTYQKLTLILLIVALVGYQAYVSRRVSKSTDYSQPQLRLQQALIWLVPAVGAFLCHLMLLESDSARERQAELGGEGDKAGDSGHDSGDGGDGD